MKTPVPTLTNAASLRFVTHSTTATPTQVVSIPMGPLLVVVISDTLATVLVMTTSTNAPLKQLTAMPIQLARTMTGLTLVNVTSEGSVTVSAPAALMSTNVKLKRYDRHLRCFVTSRRAEPTTKHLRPVDAPVDTLVMDPLMMVSQKVPGAPTLTIVLTILTTVMSIPLAPMAALPGLVTLTGRRQQLYRLRRMRCFRPSQHS